MNSLTVAVNTFVLSWRWNGYFSSTAATGGWLGSREVKVSGNGWVVRGSAGAAKFQTNVKLFEPSKFASMIVLFRIKEKCFLNWKHNYESSNEYYTNNNISFSKEVNFMNLSFFGFVTSILWFRDSLYQWFSTKVLWKSSTISLVEVLIAAFLTASNLMYLLYDKFGWFEPKK